MSITDDLNTLNAEWQQRKDAKEFRAECQRFYIELESSLSALQVIVDRGNFDTIPVSIKTELAKFRTLLTTLQSDITGDTGTVEAVGPF